MVNSNPQSPETSVFYKYLITIITILLFISQEAKSDASYTSFNEAYYNSWLSKQLNGVSEKRYDYITQSGESGYILVDVDTEAYVIEGGLDKRSSLDSLQQALFASVVSNKKPAIAIYDTDNFLGKFEFRIFSAAKRARVDVFWVRKEKIIFLNYSEEFK